jgi:hypothetical protein
MTTSGLRQMASPLLESPLIPINTIEDLKARSKRRHHQHHFVVAGGAVVAVALVLVLLVNALMTGPSTQPGGTAGLASFIVTGVSVPDSVLEQVGLPAGVTPPATLRSQSPLTDGGLPAVVYVGAEWCPYCAVQRWALVVALSRFGSFSNLGQVISSASTRPYPGLQSWSFHGSSYTSSYLRFDPAEVESSTPTQTTDGGPYESLDSLSQLQAQAYSTYDAPPFVSAAQTGGLPWIDFGNDFQMVGGSASPQVLEDLSLDQIAGDLSSPSSPVAQAIDGTANYMIASICSIIGSPNVPICSASFVTEALTRADASSAPASATKVSSGLPTVPPMPARDASMSVWHQWAAIQRTAVRETDWTKVLRQDGCTIDNVSIIPVTSPGKGDASMPAGIVTDAVTYGKRCAKRTGYTTVLPGSS